MSGPEENKFTFPDLGFDTNRLIKSTSTRQTVYTVSNKAIQNRKHNKQNRIERLLNLVVSLMTLAAPPCLFLAREILRLGIHG